MPRVSTPFLTALLSALALAAASGGIVGPPNPFDFNDDGDVDIVDLDLLCSNLGGDPLVFDTDGDGVVDGNDMEDFLLAQLIPAGDVDLDGNVDQVDRDAVRDGYGELGSWSSADFDCSGAIGLGDIAVVAWNFGVVGDAGGFPPPPADSPDLELRVDLVTGALSLVGDVDDLSAFEIRSAAGSLIPGDSRDVILDFPLAADATRWAEGTVTAGSSVRGSEDLGVRLDLTANRDLSFQWSRLSSAGVLRGRVSLQVTVPNSVTDVEGASNNSFPWGHFPSTVSVRFQQIHASTQFSEPFVIEAIAFRLDAAATRLTGQWAQAEIKLSTTSQAPATIDSTFSNNVGPDETVVYSGPLTLTSEGRGPLAGPREFDAVVPLQQPYRYDPAQGNLLMDIFHTRAVLSFPQWDAVTGMPDVLSRAGNDEDGGSMPTASFVDVGVGTVVQFVPEPATWLLGAVAIGGLALLRQLPSGRALGSAQIGPPRQS